MGSLERVKDLSSKCRLSKGKPLESKPGNVSDDEVEMKSFWNWIEGRLIL
jgi:hypothetical protein